MEFINNAVVKLNHLNEDYLNMLVDEYGYLCLDELYEETWEINNTYLYVTKFGECGYYHCDNLHLSDNYIDCGDNISLFLTLAGMTSGVYKNTPYLIMENYKDWKKGDLVLSGLIYNRDVKKTKLTTEQVVAWFNSNE